MEPYHTAFMHNVSDSDVQAPRRFFSLKDLESAPIEKEPEIVEGLLGMGTVNMLIGDSGLGKTALGMQLGMSVAGGVPFLGMPTSQGPVLYIDAESSKTGFSLIAANLKWYLKLGSSIPFFTYSLYWDPLQPFSWQTAIQDTISGIEKEVGVPPSLIIVDPLRAVWPLAETKSDETMKMIQWLRQVAKDTGATWIITHHIRKTNRDFEAPDLLQDPQGWLQEAAGSRALITSPDTRMGVCGSSNEAVDLHLSGYRRLTGTIPPLKLTRVPHPEHGEPIGYARTEAENALSSKWLGVLDQLPYEFKGSAVKEFIKQGKRSYQFLQEAIGAGLIQQDPITKVYRKV